MEEALAVTLGLGAIAVSPFIPGVRPVARKAIASGLAAAWDAVTRAAAVAGEHWKDLVAEARAEREAAAAKADRVEVDAETIVISKP